MLLILFIKMILLLVLCPFLLAAGVQTLTIDSQLGTSIEDCFDRVAIGQQLPNDSIYRNVTELTTRECEQICKQDKQCQSYDYGVGAKGNATCELGNLSEKELKDKSLLKRHPDYDVYVRRFQCEQSPPSPIQPQFDDPEPDPEKPEGLHRPIFRPDDEKFSDDYLVSTDLRPYGPGKPSSYRPDDYSNPKPDYNNSPSYGSHKPADIPYKPERPGPNQSYNSRPGDELEFQGYGPARPHKPYGNGDLDSHYAVRPTRRPYQIQDEYRPRPDPYNPNEPAADLGYGQGDAHSSGPIGPPNKPYRPNRPTQKPIRPSERPSSHLSNNYGGNAQDDHSIYLEIYDPPRPYKPVDNPYGFQGYGTYSSQYPYLQNYGSATNAGYGHNSRPDPIRRPQGPSSLNYESDETGGYGLQKPEKPYQKPQSSSYHQGSYDGNHNDYGSNQNNYESSQAGYNSNQASYGGNQGGYGSTQGSSQSSQSTHSSSQSSYGNSQSTYGSSQSSYGNQGGYGNDDASNNNPYGGGNNRPDSDTGYQRPTNPTTVKPSYGNQNTYGTNHDSFESNQSSYSSSQSHSNSNHASSSQYGYDRPSYHQDYPQKPQKPYKKPSYHDDTAQSSYGNNRPSHDSSQSSYGNSQSTHESSQSSYGSSQSSYGSNQDTYGGGQSSLGSNQAPYGSSQGSYGGNQASYGSSQGSYGGNQASHGSSLGSYGGNQASYGSGQGSYGSNQASSGSSQGSYGANQASYGSSQGSYGGNQASHGSSQGSYSGNQGSYGSSQGSYGGNQGSYGSSQGSYGGNQASYGSSQASYDGNQESYGSSQGSYGGNQGSYGSSQGSYGGNQGSYGSSQGSYGGNQGSYGSSQGSYGGNQGSYGSSQGSYGSNDSDYGTSQGSYGGSQSSHGNNQAYGTNRPYKDDRYNNKYRPKPNYDSPNTGYNNQKPDISNQYGSGSGGYEKPVNESNYSQYPGVKPVYEYEADRPSDVPSYIARPGGDVIASKPVVIGDYGDRPGYKESGKGKTYLACFRRVLAGRRTLRSHVRKAIPCERLEDCRRECATEIRFPCESFNYRLDPTFRGKGLCELMTKPIEAFDLRRDFVDDKDYDFYELDRNSLEPNCPDTLRGPGLLHSGYLSSKPDRRVDNRWRDQNWFYSKDDRYSYNRFDRRGSGNRYYSEQSYVPYQIGVGRSDEDLQNWGQYGGHYGIYNSHYKDSKDYQNSVNHWRLANDADRFYGVRPLVDTREHEKSYVRPVDDYNNSFDYGSLGKSLVWTNRYGYGSWKRGRWNNSGLSWSDYEYNQHEAEDRKDDIDSRDCSSRRRPGMSLGSGAIRRSLIARNVVECEAACFAEKEFKCVSYSYRYSNSHGSDNCFLSERPYRGLELSADSGSDVYAMPQDQGCVAINYRPWVESECFWHVRSGAAVSDVAARAALTVAGLGACEAECLRANGFFCRGFSFRFDSPTIGDDLDNCILTSSPPTSLEVGRGLRPNPGHELYSRGNYGRGCEPALYDDIQHRDSECYLQYDSASKLIGSAIRGQARVKDEKSCGVACTDAPFGCLSFSFNNNSPPDVDNCFLSEIRLFDLQKGVDYVHSLDDWLFAFDLFNGQCWRKVSGKAEYDISPELPHPIPVSGSEEIYSSGPDSSEHEYLPEPPGPVYIHGSGPSGPKPYSTRPYIPSYEHKPIYAETNGPSFKPGYNTEPSGPVYKHEYFDDIGDSGSNPVYHDKNGFKPGYPVEPSGPGYRPGFTASGRPGYDSHTNFKPGFATINDKPHDHWESSGYKPGYEPDRPRPLRPQKPVYHGDREESDITVSWRHYTVSGFPCRAGTSCAQNHVAGHWACEPEGGEVGSWDYCCAPSHRCGYSEGFHKPWCYVGQTQDQWRPCSEKYYPYHQHSEPHPSQGNRDNKPRPSRPWNDQPEYVQRPQGPYLSEADQKYWDDLYRNGPQAYYDKYGNPLPGYARVPTAERPYIKYSHNHRQPGGGQWVSVPTLQPDLDRAHFGLGAPRYWPVAYLHKGPPPNITYFRYNETSTTVETPTSDLPAQSRDAPTEIYVDKSNSNIDKHKDEKKRNISDFNEDNLKIDSDPTTTIKTVTTEVTPIQEHEKVKMNYTVVEATKPTKANHSKYDVIDGIDDKLLDFSRSIEVFDIEDAKKHDKPCEMIEAEERQIEEIGRLIASKRGGKLVLEEQSQKDLESKNIAVNTDFNDFNFGNNFPTNERRGVVQKVTKDEIERERNADRSLEVSETTYVRPPRVLPTTDNIRKAIVNGKVFYDATIREQRDLHSNSTRRAKSLRPLEERAPSVITSSNFGRKKVIKTRNVNPVRRVKRVYKKRYNPEEVRRKLLEREKNLKGTSEMTKHL